MREHAAQGLAYICTAVARNPAVQDEALLAPLAALLGALIMEDPNRFSMGWAAEALRRLVPCSAAAEAAFEKFLGSGRWKPAEMQLELGIDQTRYGADPLMPGLFAP